MFTFIGLLLDSISTMVGRIHFSKRDYCSLNMREVKLRIPLEILSKLGILNTREGWQEGLQLVGGKG